MPNYLIALLIGFIGLDTTIAFQVLISQPIFSCSILGWIFGDPALGVEIGIMMQLLWINIIPSGATTFPEANIASMVTCAIALKFAQLGLPNLVFTSAFIIGIIVSYAGDRLTIIDRKLNGKILDMILKAARDANLSKITFLDIVSIIIYFSIMSTLTFLALLLADWLVPLLQERYSYLENKLILVKPAIWGMGIALTTPLVVKTIRTRT